jgi:hypothetical protein
VSSRAAQALPPSWAIMLALEFPRFSECISSFAILDIYFSRAAVFVFQASAHWSSALNCSTFSTKLQRPTKA